MTTRKVFIPPEEIKKNSYQYFSKTGKWKKLKIKKITRNKKGIVTSIKFDPPDDWGKCFAEERKKGLKREKLFYIKYLVKEKSNYQLFPDAEEVIAQSYKMILLLIKT